jgi:hypothetical protein
MRQIIAALQVSLDGFIEGPNVELDWVDSWEDTFDIIGNVDTFILGARMYPGPLLRASRRGSTSSARPRTSSALSLNGLIRRTYPLREEARRKG